MIFFNAKLFIFLTILLTGVVNMDDDERRVPRSISMKKNLWKLADDEATSLDISTSRLLEHSLKMWLRTRRQPRLVEEYEKE